MTISPFRASGPCRRAHPAPGYPADGSQHSDTGSAPASPDSGFLVSTSDPSQPLRALPLAQRPRVLSALPDAWCPRRGPLLTSRDRARPGPGEAPLGSRLRRVYADPEKPPRPREKRRESPRPVPPPATGLVMSAARLANGVKNINDHASTEVAGWPELPDPDRYGVIHDGDVPQPAGGGGCTDISNHEKCRRPKRLKWGCGFS
ncbi:hypothetical protein J1605_001038 [Eschrichtius robustus]|uniref:Uncharacterized protein n=1 Tax=Eschrichtius robustus TaxID=9764 RepID=A0AB34GQL2_ESCRO|nr:hypothetical protein J1605_001038 [Eschrichtius robustus]